MWKKIAIGGAVAAAIVGVGTAAVATSGTTSTPGSPTTSSATDNSAAAKALRKHPGLARALGKRLVHGQIVTEDPKTNQLVTHDLIHGSVTSVSSTSITVVAADKTSETFVVDSGTKVRLRTAGKPGSGHSGAIGDVKVGDQVIVVGTGTSTFTATGILDGV